MTGTQEQTVTHEPSTEAANFIRIKPYGTSRGERKAGRKAAALAKQAARLASSSSNCKSITCAFQGSAAEAALWDEVYHRKASCYRDRHLLRAEFPELMPVTVRLSPRTHIAPLERSIESGPLCASPSASAMLLEVGCGHGSGLFPILRANPRLFALAFDFSARAVELLRAHAEFRSDRVRAFQADVTDWNTLETYVAEGAVQFVTAFWTLSALHGQGLASAARNIQRAMRKGGLLFVRDFAKGDMREERFGDRNALVETTETAQVFRRGDGTLAAFFTKEGLRKVFEQAGLRLVRGEIVERTVENRAEGKIMHRKWIQMVFTKPDDEDLGTQS